MIWTLLLSASLAHGSSEIKLVSGYVTKIQCEGKLFVSAIGNDKLVQLAALPKELGCGVLLKPFSMSGRTNLILETSQGTIQSEVEIVSYGKPVSIISLKAGDEK